MGISDALEKALNDFKSFALDSKSMDIAIGMILGAAVEPVAKSLVEDIVTPTLGLIGKNKLDLKDKYILLKNGKRGGPYDTKEQAANDGAVTIGYGKLISTLMNFLVLSGSAYAFVKLMEKLRKAKISIPDANDLRERIGFQQQLGAIQYNNPVNKNIQYVGLGGMSLGGAAQTYPDANIQTWGYQDKYNRNDYNLSPQKRAFRYFRQKSPANQKETRRRIAVNRSPFYDVYNQYYAHKSNSGVYAQEKMPAWEDFVYDSRYWKTTLGGNFQKRGPVPMVHFPVAYREEVEGQYLRMPYGMEDHKKLNLSEDY